MTIDVFTGGWFHDTGIVDSVLSTYTDGWFGTETAQISDAEGSRSFAMGLDEDEEVIAMALLLLS